MASPSPTPTPTPIPLKLLSLDGGGIRGLSSLIILKHLMKRVKPQSPPKPCEYFDLIGGTSTGGLIAIMLGRLQMDIDTCIEKYLELSSAAFQPKRVKANIFGRAKDIWKVGGVYSSERLATEIRTIVESQEGDAQAKFMKSDAPCKTFVCAFTKALNTPVLFRTYTTDDAVDALASSECTIWQAARATSAAATFFDPIEIGRQQFVDGATGLNNPVEVVFDEAKSIWPNAIPRIQCIVSIGTGVPDLRDFGDNLKEVVETLKNIAAETEETERKFFKNHKQFGVGDRYFRFNVQQGLGGVGLDEREKLDKIEAATEFYLGVPQVKETVTAFIAARPSNMLPPLDAASKENHIRWLKPIDSSRYHEEARKYRTTKSTGSWFLEGDFKVWKTNPRSFLWLYGKLGCGKTILSYTIIDKIEQQKLGDLAYFYFSYRRNEPQDARSLMSSLLTQLVCRLVRKDSQKSYHYHLPRAFRDLYDKYQPASTPDINDLNATILEVLMESKETYIVIDALDECPLEDDRREIIKFLAELSRDAPSRTHILVTSRREKDIENAISKIFGKRCIIPIQDSRVDEDIRRHLQNCFEKDEGLNEFSVELQTKAIEHLTAKADGVFRWVDCQLITLKRLKAKTRKKDVEKALNQLPKDLDETYSRMLLEINESLHADEARAVLKWLAFSKRDLKLSEVAEAAIFGLDPQNGSVLFDPEDRFESPLEIRAILSGLVTVSGVDDQFCLDNEETNTYQDGVISFAHFSVKEYLMCNRVKPPEFQLRDPDDQCFVLKSCLAYIQHYDTKASEKSGSERYPLLLYACKYWSYHAMALYSNTDQSTIRTLVKRLTEILTELHGNAFVLSMRVALDSNNHPSNERLPYVLRDVFKDLEGEDYFMKLAFDFEGYSALRSASNMGHKGLVKLLLDGGVNANEMDDEGETALHWAAKEGHEAVVRLLLENGADVDAKHEKSVTARRRPQLHDGEGGTALHRAGARGHEAVARLLLDHGADVDAKDGEEGTALHWAAEFARKATVRLLLEKGADVAAKDWEGVTPLHGAARRGHEAVVKLLLEKEVDLDSKDTKYGQTSLSWAVERGRMAVARLLLEKGADVEAKNNCGQMALHQAAKSGYDVLVQLLVENGADVKAKDNSGKTALHWAAGGGCEAVVALLVEKGADVKSKDNSGETALHRAAGGGCEVVVALLLEKGADVDAKTGSGRTALQKAAGNGREAVVRLLLEKGANAENKNVEAWLATAQLLNAAKNRDEGVVRLLLEKGADVQATDNSEETALHCAAGEGREAVVALLLEKGADVKAKDNSGETALHRAAGNGREAVVALLVEKGADVKAKDNSGETALHRAAGGGHGPVALLLLNYGADISAKSTAGETALRWAVTKRRESVARLLQEKGADFAAMDDDRLTALHWEAWLKREKTDPQRAPSNNLEVELISRYMRTGAIEDLKQAVLQAKEAVTATPVDRSDRAGRLNNLGSMLAMMYERTGAIEDLQQAALLAEEAVADTSVDHSDRASWLYNLGSMLALRYKRTHDMEDFDKSVDSFVGSSQCRNAQPSLRIKAAWEAARLLVKQAKWEESSSLLHNAVSLLPSVCPHSLEQNDQQHKLGEFAGLAAAAALMALQAGKEASHAMELLELGRSVIIGLQFKKRTDLADLRVQYPEIATQFELLQDDLDWQISNSSHSIFGNESNRRYTASGEFDEVVGRIRTLPNFQNFLLPAPAAEMMTAASLGPVVVINVSRYRCNAFLLETHSIRMLPLPLLHHLDIEENVKLMRSIRHSSTSSRHTRYQMSDMLEWLWDVVAGPILDALGFRNPPSDDKWPHIWWIPTGILSLLPLHAAGYHVKDGWFPRSGTVLDRVVSSYSSSITALLCARQNRVQTNLSGTSDEVLTVSMRTTPGCSDLEFAGEEVKVLDGLIPASIPRVKLEQPCKEAVLARLNTCTVFHFAGHCKSDPLDPSKSCLLISDWQENPLTVEHLIGLKSCQKYPWLAYLSACSTGENQVEDLHDEAIHLMTAFQLAGFQHVVGSLWEVSDRHSVDAARNVYQAIKDGGIGNDESIAIGVHKAAKFLRDITKQSCRMSGVRMRDMTTNWEMIREGDPLIWAAYIHVGP